MDIPDKIQWIIMFLVIIQIVATFFCGLTLLIVGVFFLIEGEALQLVTGASMLGITVAEGFVILVWASDQ